MDAKQLINKCEQWSKEDRNNHRAAVILSDAKTLTPGAYSLPNDCKAFVRNGKVIVSRKRNTDDTPRCRDCKHCVHAKSKYNQYYASPVCDLQPKANRGYSNRDINRQKRFYSVRPSETACEKYEPKEPETK